MGLLRRAGLLHEAFMGSEGGEESAEPSGRVAAVLRRFQEGKTSFQGIVLEKREGEGGARGGLYFYGMVIQMASILGAALPLKAGRSLVLLPGGMDRELIAHRLSKSLHARTPLLFEAKNACEALSALQSYL